MHLMPPKLWGGFHGSDGAGSARVLLRHMHPGYPEYEFCFAIPAEVTRGPEPQANLKRLRNQRKNQGLRIGCFRRFQAMEAGASSKSGHTTSNRITSEIAITSNALPAIIKRTANANPAKCQRTSNEHSTKCPNWTPEKCQWTSGENPARFWEHPMNC